jgi:hypothetical protein
MFDDASTYDHYLPNDTFNWRNNQVLDTVKCPWRFSIDHMAWTDHEVELNGGEGAGRDYVKSQYKRLKKSKEQRLWTSLLNGFENDLWQTPYGNYSEMEGAGGKLPYSLPSFISEIPDASNPLGLRGGVPLGWTNVMNLANGTTGEARWTNQISNYNTNSSAGANDKLVSTSGVYNPRDNSTYTALIGGLMTAFDDMFLKCDFQPPSTRQEYFEKATLNRQMILCSRLGLNQYKQALRASNDTLVSYQDAAYGSPSFSGIELMYCANLDTAAIYPKFTTARRVTATTNIGASVSTAGVTESDTTGVDVGARFWWVNGNYLTPVYHASRYFAKHDVMRHPNQPFTYVQVVDCWWNLFCNSRQRQGIVSPIQVS